MSSYRVVGVESAIVCTKHKSTLWGSVGLLVGWVDYERSMRLLCAFNGSEN